MILPIDPLYGWLTFHQFHPQLHPSYSPCQAVVCHGLQHFCARPWSQRARSSHPIMIRKLKAFRASRACNVDLTDWPIPCAVDNGSDRNYGERSQCGGLNGVASNISRRSVSSPLGDSKTRRHVDTPSQLVLLSRLTG